MLCEIQLNRPDNDEEITNGKDVVNEIRRFYSNLFKLQKKSDSGKMR